MRTQVGIVGAGPAGPDARAPAAAARASSRSCSRRAAASYVEQRIRAGVLEQGTVDLLDAAGVGERMRREGLVHHGIELQFDGERHRIPLQRAGRRPHDRRLRPDGGRQGPDRRAARERRAAPVRGRRRQPCRDLDRATARVIRFEHEGAHAGARVRLRSPAATGSTASAAPTIPDGRRCARSRASTRSAGSGILAAVAPSSDELVYAHHERGFALLSLRSPELSRLYVQCRPDEDIARVAGRAHLGGAAAAARPRRLDAGRGPGPREGRDRHAQLRRRADAATGASTWPATPRTSSRRPARRASTSRSPTCGCWPRRSRAGYETGSTRCSTPTPRRACAASGAPSTSPGG